MPRLSPPSPTVPVILGQLSRASNEAQLRNCFMDQADRLFTARGWGINFFGEHHEITESEIAGLDNSLLDRYMEIGIAADPVMSYVLSHHVPAHNHSATTPAGWENSLIYRELSRSYHIEHLLASPIVGQGRLLGKLYCTRGRYDQPFNDRDLVLINSISQHFSVQLALLRTRPLSPPSALTPREQEILYWIAQGRTNPEIAIILGISTNGVKQALKRMFAKLQVSSRAALVASATGLQAYEESSFL